jgi:nitroimidazol reductase NimA-like FMN-containing flavoprotein (pyridoxamine 5'-phosphate oxidase superfamily)
VTQPHGFGRPPAAERPASPPASYGVPQQGGLMVDWQFVTERLTSARTYWLGTVSADGRPHSAPIWGVFVGDDLFLETAPFTRKARHIERSGAVSVHVELGDEAVIVEGDAAEFRPEPDLGQQLAAAFASKYEGYRPAADAWDGGSLYLVTPRTVFAWRDMPTATRWRFDSNA